MSRLDMDDDEVIERVVYSLCQGYRIIRWETGIAWDRGRRRWIKDMLSSTWDFSKLGGFASCTSLATNTMYVEICRGRWTDGWMDR